MVVKYDPAVARSGPERVSAEYHQVKWHTEYGGRFGYEDLIDPAFIGATRFSLLQRLQKARLASAPSAQFTFITTHRCKDGDPLAELISGNDKSLLVEKLFDDTTDKSRMGRVRQLWREHLKLASDEELRDVVSRLRILEGYRSLDELRSSINLRAKVVGLLTCGADASDFRYDELARKLKVRRLNTVTRETLLRLCHEEGLFAECQKQTDAFLSIAIRSFLGPAADIVGATQENTLLLIDDFRQRYLRNDLDWQRNIRPKVQEFLRSAVVKSPRLRLILDAHASIAFLAGSVLDTKSGVEVELVQKGRVGSRTWRADDGSAVGAALFGVREERVGAGTDIAVAVSISQATGDEARTYTASRLPNVGALLTFALPAGPGQSTVVGGEHDAILAEVVSNAIRKIKGQNCDALVHIFAACPNSFLFYLGQHHQAIAPCIVYEYDFDRRSHKTYQPSFQIE